MTHEPATAVSERTKLEVVELSKITPDPKWAHALPAAGARRFRVIALCQVGEQVIVATSNPHWESAGPFLEKHLGKPFRFVQADERDVLRLIHQMDPRYTAMMQGEEGDAECETVRVCDELLRAAVARGASDIHLLPQESQVHAKFRVDGVLEDYRTYPKHLHAGLVSRIKVMAGMNIAEKREPQDGRFSVNDGHQKRRMDIRVAAIPSRFGERLTLRLLIPMATSPSLTQLGMCRQSMDTFERAIASSHGLVLLTGPTGCGKSTTLYTAITELLRMQRGNIITVEDPVEYEIAGATQVEVDAMEKVSFARALRSILRHDPDVIMLGEIRDRETAEIAVKASLTGHLVFSTLHTNTAAGAVTRLIDMGVEPYLLAATLRLAVAQRLVRKLCPRCKTDCQLDTLTAQALGNPQFAGTTAYQPTGCVYCMGRGYAGRVALFEMLPVDSDVATHISQQATERDLLDHMRQNGQPLLLDDGTDKIFSGTTTARQVLSAVAVG